MPINELGMNDDYVSYFSLEEYIDRIKLTDSLLFHLEDTSKDFDEYIKLLSNYDDDEIINYWIDTAHQELRASQHLEHANLNESILREKGIAFDSLNITHKRIHDIHNFIMASGEEPYTETNNYRKTPVKISRYKDDGTEEIFWRGANPEDVLKFMNDYIKAYKQNKISLLYSNPFINAALMSLLFNRIHPYTDGNGRTSRVIYNLKFTEQINKLYQTKLVLCPLNLSNRILVNKYSYVNTIDHIAFNLTDDTNIAINNWFDFILTMADEQLFYSEPRLERLVTANKNMMSDSGLSQSAKKMRLSRLK